MAFLSGRGRGLPIITLLLIGATAAPVSAQYFGRQKVQYDDFNWRTMQTPRFLIHYYPSELEVTHDGARMAERWYTRFTGIFQHEFDEIPLIFYADHPDFQQTNVISSALGEGTGGVTEGLRTRVIMPWTGIYAENDHVLGHELVHVFQYDLAASPTGGGLAGLSRLPDWLVEGMAEYLSIGRVDAHTAMWMRDAALRGELPSIQQLTTDRRFFPYRYGQALWAYVAGRWGDRAVPEILRISTHAGFEEALVRVLGVGSNQLSQEWIAQIRADYLPLLEGRQRPQDAGRPILFEEGPGALNISPAVSPDGSMVAYIGTANLLTADLLLADAETGEVIRTLSSPQRDPHMDAISYIQSAGTWAPDGERFAFIIFKDGNNQIEIVNARSGDRERRIETPGIGGILHVSWSPDGRHIAFVGQAGGQSDLYLYDLENREITQLTDDRYADLMPAWSPDGSTIAFSTDRGPSTDFGRLTYGKMNIALLDLATRNVRVLEIFEGTKHINPYFAPDGQSLFFISDREGISDIYRIELASQKTYQVTRLATGVSGITALAPAFSIASTGRVMFSAFEYGGNNVYSMECSQGCGVEVARTPQTGVPTAAVLSPVSAYGGGTVYAYLSDEESGLPPEDVEFETHDYHASIALDYLGPPSFGVGASDYGAYLGGGVSAFFGDMLGDHFLATAIQANGTVKDIGGQAIYLNSGNRLNWGAAIGHIPYLTGFSQLGQDGNTLVLDQILERVYVDEAALITQYPFSMTRRIELQAGLTRYSFDREIHRVRFNAAGQPISGIEVIDVESPDPITFFETSVAWVGDNSFFGFVGPISGKRFRFQASPTFGTLNFVTGVADYRTYTFMNPFTFATRFLHYGRYGGDADGITDDGTRVLSPLFLGQEPFMRGYDRQSIAENANAECRPVEEDAFACPVFDRLLGSRIAVANFEFRIPLIGFEQFGLINFPFLPTEVAPFLDAGIAWSSGDDVNFDFRRDSLDRIPVFSAGISARVNLLGFAVLESYYAYPFQRPDKGWHWGFQLYPGW